MDNLNAFVIAFKRAGIVSEHAERLGEYGASLLEINESLNLTGAKDAWELTGKHLADAYFALKTIEEGHVLASSIWDVGSGGGIPGIPLAILRPNLQVTLVERRQKKAMALEELAEYSGVLEQTSVHAQSLELLKPLPEEAQFWFRGVLPGPKLITYLSQYFNEGELGEIVLMKGPAWEQERDEALKVPKIKPYWRKRFENDKVLSYALPEGLGERKLVIL